MPESTDAIEKISARLARIIFENQQTGYLVGLFSTGRKQESFTGCGLIKDAQKGQSYELYGNWTVHPRYGNQFAIKAAKLKEMTHKDSLVTFLSSDKFTGIGKKTAQKIVDTLGEDALSIIRDDSSVLSGKCELSEEKAEIIEKGLHDYDGYSSSLLQLVRMGLSEHEIELISNRVDDIPKMLNVNPFLPFYFIPGFGYEGALKLADGMHLPDHDIRRLEASLFDQITRTIYQRGDTYMTKTQLFAPFMGIETKTLEEALFNLQSQRAIIIEEDRVFLRAMYFQEKKIAELLEEHTFEVDKPDPKRLEELIEATQEKEAIQYDPIQKQAIRAFFENSLMILNGGPGTGKSTTVKGMMDILRTLMPDARIALCAPTGRAAKRLNVLTDTRAKTIHSLLKWNMDNNLFAMNEDDPLDCDFLVVDETSMVDTYLFSALLKALKPNCRILLIGDGDQLESVSPGKVFNDLIDSGRIKTITLKTLFRQSSGSGIAQLADEIRQEKPLEFTDGVSFFESEGEELMECLKKLMENAPDPAQFQILAPKYKGQTGIDAINALMQELLNPFSQSKAEIVFNNVVYREGDRVLLKQNMPEQNVYNGDIGEVVRVDPKAKVLEVDFDGTLVAFENIIVSLLTHAWCISIHKSQGSEYRSVAVVVDPQARWMLDKRLLYTGISRAKRSLCILGHLDQFEQSCRLNPRRIRQTYLKERLQQKLEPIKEPASDQESTKMDAQLSMEMV